MSHRKTAKFVAALAATITIVACGGGGDVAGNSFPLTATVIINATNSDTQNIHFLMQAEAFDPSNRVLPGTTTERASDFTRTWDNASQVHEINVFAGRGEVVLAGPVKVNISGDARMAGKKIIATWNGTTLTAGLSH